MHAKAVNVGIHECHTKCMDILSIITSSDKIKGGPGVLGISNFTTLVNKINKFYKLGFWITLIPKAAPSCNRGLVLLLFDSQGPKLFLGLFCNTLQNNQSFGPVLIQTGNDFLSPINFQAPQGPKQISGPSWTWAQSH